MAVNGTAESPVSSVEEFTQTPFDFIIVGGGTAGLVIAARLSEDPNVTVGVVEAGKYKINDPIIDTPTAFIQTFENPEYEWCMYTTPQASNRGRTHHIPRGKVLGGSSAINYMMYVRGSSQDYDDWAALAGDDGWSASAMQQYMRKHQVLEPIDPAAHETAAPCVAEFHGTSGPIHTTFNQAQLPIETDFVKASAESIGLPNQPVDAWSGDHIGFYHTLGTVTRTGPHKGKRSYAGRDYYEANSARPNLKLLCEANVNKVVLDGTRATGVSLTFQGQEYQVSAKREVIVSGGAIKSPQILELSGIGDPDVLNAAGVEVKVENRAVGANVQDHVVTLVGFHTLPGVMTSDTLYQVPEAMQAVLKEYLETQGGPLSAISNTQGFFPAKKILSEAELAEVVQSIRDTKPTTEFHAKQLEQIIAHLETDTSANMQVVLLAGTVNPAQGVEHQSKMFAPPPPGQPCGVSTSLCIQYPVARGSIHIQSNDPTAPPVIDPNYIGHEADVTLLAAFSRWADRLGRSDTLKPSLAGRYYPKASVDLQDLEQAKESVRDAVSGEYHICGSVALGDALDSRLRVKGAEGLRVADASIFPNNVSGNIVGTVYAVGEKAADLIKEDHGLA
ncbi:GMC oxidoreductase-domain-containing protein [Aspergillus granulosus]|uniref:GMC oxidoreductase-domain-containing protein n=1 Tax=Aspergillus granulosus TaxID=176169 RepID=A0ABR4HF55_9EURO